MQRKLSIISSLHYVKLIYRGALFLWALMLWLTQKQFHTMGYSQISVQFKALFYAVADMICILFFCPFQTWMMKNRCCTTCRVYNWDYLMMCTPLILIPAGFTWSLTVMAILLFIRWELNAALHPERFTEETNQSMRCANCQEKLCHHKKQLHSFWKHERIKKQKDCLQE